MSQVVVSVEGYAPVVVSPGCTLLEACEQGAIPMESACGGFACCNSCRVLVTDGAESLSDCLEEEHPFLDAPGQRLACQATVRGSLSCRLAPGM